jgi:hypothetical protein
MKPFTKVLSMFLEGDRSFARLLPGGFLFERCLPLQRFAFERRKKKAIRSKPSRMKAEARSMRSSFLPSATRTGMASAISTGSRANSITFRISAFPIFGSRRSTPSPSYHKYDVKDYYAIDSSFGSLADFSTLVSSAKAHHIGIIMDMVFNHASSQSSWFPSIRDRPRERQHRSR